MDNIFKRIKTFLIGSDIPSEQEINDMLSQRKDSMDSLTYLIEELIRKETFQREKLKMIEDFLEKIGLDIPPPELDDTATDDDEAADLMSIYASIVRKITRPIWEECVKAGTDAVDDLVEAVNSQMAELS